MKISVFIRIFFAVINFYGTSGAHRVIVLTENSTELLNIVETLDGKDIYRTITLLEGHFPIVLYCTSTKPTQWTIEKNGHTGHLKNSRLERLTEYKTEQVEYTAKLTVTQYSSDIITSIKCSSIETISTPTITIGIFYKPDNNEQPIFLHPGSTHIIHPVVGDKEILLPCHVSYVSGDVYVEKLKTFSTTIIDLEFDQKRNGFIIPTSGILTSGTFNDLNKYIGSYRCSQIGLDTFMSITVEIVSPVEPIASEITAEAGQSLSLICGAHVPIKLAMDENDKIYNVTYFHNPKYKFKFRGMLTYDPYKSEKGRVTCATDRGEMLQQWKFTATDYEVHLQITTTRKEIKCSTSNNVEERVKLTLKYCQRHEECFLNPVQNDDNFIVTPCKEKSEERCISAKPMKTGGMWANCTVGRISKVQLFYADINLNLFTQNEVVPPSSIAASVDEKDFIFVYWSSFYLSDGILWEFPTENFNLLESKTKLHDGSYRSKLSKLKSSSSNPDKTINVKLAVWNMQNVQGLNSTLHYVIYPNETLHDNAGTNLNSEAKEINVLHILLDFLYAIFLSLIVKQLLMYFHRPGNNFTSNQDQLEIQRATSHRTFNKRSITTSDSDSKSDSNSNSESDGLVDQTVRWIEPSTKE